MSILSGDLSLFVAFNENYVVGFAIVLSVHMF